MGERVKNVAWGRTNKEKEVVEKLLKQLLDITICHHPSRCAMTWRPPKFCSHTQSTERCVKLVTEAAAKVCGQEARDGYIRARVRHREAMSTFDNKDILATF